MYNAGLATTQVSFEAPTEVIDGLGAPSRTWATVRTCFAQTENEVVTAVESSQAPYMQNTRSFTLVIRTAPNVSLTTQHRVRAVDNSWFGNIIGIRYSTKKDILFIDVETGLTT